MMKRILLIWLSATLCISLSAQTQSDLVSVGLRGGMSVSLLTASELSFQPQPSGTFDLAYTHYWRTPNQTDVGIHTGISLGYSAYRFESTYIDLFTNTDYLQNAIQYTISSSLVTERAQQLQLEIPLRLAIRAKQAFIHIGPKITFPALSWYQQDLSNLLIDAYYELPDVHVRNEVITGQADEALLHQAGTGSMPFLSLWASFDAGYEWALDDKNRLGLGVYMDFSPWSYYRPNTTSAKLIEVGAITNPNYPPADVQINPLSSSIATQHHFFDIGVRFYYAFEKMSAK